MGDQRHEGSEGSERDDDNTDHGAAAAEQVAPHHQAELPERVRRRGAGRDHALVRERVVQRVGPEGRVVVEDGDGGVEGEVGGGGGVEHGVAADLQERRAHAADVLALHAAVQRQDLLLAADLAQPLVAREPLAEAVSVIDNSQIIFHNS